MKLIPIILVGVGGMLGSILRYFMVVLFTKQFPNTYIPYGTIIVNILGCLVIGIVLGMSERFQLVSPHLRLFLATGLCGGFTTFSAFAYENISLLQHSDYLGFVAYAVGSVLLGMLAVFAGLSFIKIF